MSFLKPLTPDEYRKKHPRCAYCMYLKYSCKYITDPQCSISGKRIVFPDNPRLFCRMYQPKPFTV